MKAESLHWSHLYLNLLRKTVTLQIHMELMYRHILTFHLLCNIGFLCAEKVQQRSDLDIQRRMKELDKLIEKLSQQCAKTDKRSALVRHTLGIPKP